MSSSLSLQQTFLDLQSQLETRIIGQKTLVNRLLMALLADGHLLVEGAPGLAKTTAIKTLAEYIEGDFHRIQFTPDLLPSDVTGSEIYRAETGLFEFQRGPVFHNLVLADEINRAPAKVQSALLEAMGERQVSVGMNTFALEPLFLVMATQNPIEQEGTYPLPEAQLDRFLMHVLIDYPDASAERKILHLARRDFRQPAAAVTRRVSASEVFAARLQVADVHMSEAVEDYLLALVLATRKPAELGPEVGPELARWASFGASPRGTIALDRCSRAQAWLDGRDYVTPDDIRNVAFDVLRHRVLLNFDAQAEGISTDDFLRRLLECLPVTA
ncbi:MoxR family ATPase [Marinobacter sp. M3C]|jgi:MoxR-like ATPase|uniref:AAA family ATPase n=1 Tax=unclassified Marinobacter TaxID=83889 RepID=UPI00200FDAFD|nr:MULTISPECIES: MoxR family ATPase [unclassified Marinobacter]MCL1476733.1 MoxR family ATPase [Marinobacter sp.]MCL1479839.1 MoxR family ATPase [Marinobacter sp.]MCL1484955.1 MoxR family ATPase [Marinobacter sp.]UQG57260.1 MoxR family ATPase [Marinobacter sp. M4C]UQG61557.1 MoxR family ATPase [Marinobacter sp. M3C]